MITRETKIDKIWNDTKREAVSGFILEKSKNQSKESVLKNKLLAIQIRRLYQ
jgi:hypothetical protein